MGFCPPYLEHPHRLLRGLAFALSQYSLILLRSGEHFGPKDQRIRESDRERRGRSGKAYEVIHGIPIDASVHARPCNRCGLLTKENRQNEGE